MLGWSTANWLIMWVPSGVDHSIENSTLRFLKQSRGISGFSEYRRVKRRLSRNKHIENCVQR
jgi:hypothetical protein